MLQVLERLAQEEDRALATMTRRLVTEALDRRGVGRKRHSGKS
jgi:hypothetical protein